MNHSKFFAALIALALLSFGCGSNTTTTPVATTNSGVSTASSSSTGTTASTVATLSLAVSATTVVEGGTVTFTASGGVPFTSSSGTSTYIYVNESGSLGSITSAGVFTASSSQSGVATIMVEDEDGNTATKTVTVTSAMTVTASATTLAAGGTVTFTVTGGTPPYLYLLPIGDGSLSVSGSSDSSSTVYTSSTLDTTDIEVEVIDSSSPAQTVYSTVAITASSSGSSSGTTASSSGISSYASLLTDDMLGITFYNTSALSSPEIALFGTGSKPDEATMFAHTAVQSCGHDALGDTNAPCTQFLSLTNYVNGSNYTTAYTGTINFNGRSGSGYVSFCIPPSSGLVQSAYLLPGTFSGSGSNNLFLDMTYNDTKDGRAFLGGTAATSFYSETDTNNGYGFTDVWLSDAGFISSTTCAGFGDSLIQVF